MESERETQGALECTGEVRKTVQYLRLELFLSFFPRIVLEGFSTFFVNANGTISMHKMERVSYV